MYTLSFDASLKLNKGSVKGFLHHMARDVDRENGKELNHSNENINSALTEENETYYYDSSTQYLEPCTDINQIEQALNERLSTVKKSLRKDAVVARGFVLQLDPEWYKEHTDNDEREQSYDDMIDWACEQFGIENLVSVSIHMDETNPHMHVLFTPVTEDGRLSQKDWFKSPSSLRAMHDNFRKYMIDKGYDIDTTRKPAKERLSEDDYKTYAELKQANEALFDAAIEAKADLDTERYLMQLEYDNAYSEMTGDVAIVDYEQTTTAYEQEQKSEEQALKDEELTEREQALEQEKAEIETQKAQNEAKAKELDIIHTELQTALKGLALPRSDNDYSRETFMKTYGKTLKDGTRITYEEMYQQYLSKCFNNVTNARSKSVKYRDFKESETNKALYTGNAMLEKERQTDGLQLQ